MKLISRREKDVMVESGIIDKNLDGLNIASRSKTGAGKTYYCREDLAFKVWAMLGTHRDDPDFIKWTESSKGGKRNTSFYNDSY